MKRLSSLIASILFLGVLLGCSKNDNQQEPEIEVIIDKTANLQGTGDSANDILSNDEFDKMLVEIAYVTGFRPTQASMDAFVGFLKQHTFKDQIEMVYTELESPNVESLELQKIADLESENRTAYNTGNTLAVYIYFADAPSSEDDEDEGLVTLGAVYRNTSMVIHEVTVRKLAGQSPLISNSDVESATLNHEFGHLFGLVNLGSPMVNDHEDEDAKNHCNQEGCLMRAELQFTGFTSKSQKFAKNDASGELSSACSLTGQSVLTMLKQNVSKGNAVVPEISSECILDLQANGGN